MCARVLRALAVSASASLLTACATVLPPPVPVPPVPGQGGPAWRELTSEHFIVWTDAAPDRDGPLMTAMEHLQQVVYGVSFFKPITLGKTFVVALRNVEEVHAYVEPQFIAYAEGPQNPLHTPVIVLPVDHLENDRRIITHELTHAISYTPLPVQPHWFAEGLAGYFETLRLDENHKKADVGMPLEGRVRSLREDHPLPLASVYACNAPACMNDRYYASTWALFTFLMNQHPRELLRYMAALAELKSGEAPAWDTVVPELGAEQMQTELAQWLAHGGTTVREYDVTLKPVAFEQRVLGDADAYAARAVVRSMAGQHGDVPELAAALAVDPTHLIANVLRAARDHTVSPDLARRIVEAHPDDWRAWFLAWRAAQNATESLEAREKTCALWQAHPTAVPIEGCERDETGAFAEDPRRAVFHAAVPQLNACLKNAKTPREHGAPMILDIDIDERGVVTAASASVGSTEAGACIEDVLKKLTFPAHHAGRFHVGTTRPAAKP
jgi:hypothetical protein